MNEAPESLGIIRPTISYDLIRKTAAKVVFLGVSVHAVTEQRQLATVLLDCPPPVVMKARRSSSI